jgi:hypothetical protein
MPGQTASRDAVKEYCGLTLRDVSGLQTSACCCTEPLSEAGHVLRPLRSPVPLLQHLEPMFRVPSASPADRQKLQQFQRRTPFQKSANSGSSKVRKNALLASAEENRATLSREIP